MTKRTMTREDEHEFYARPENQEPQGPARRRAPSKLPEVAEGERPEARTDRGAGSTSRHHAHEA